MTLFSPFHREGAHAHQKQSLDISPAFTHCLIIGAYILKSSSVASPRPICHGGKMKEPSRFCLFFPDFNPLFSVFPPDFLPFPRFLAFFFARGALHHNPPPPWLYATAQKRNHYSPGINLTTDLILFFFCFVTLYRLKCWIKLGEVLKAKVFFISSLLSLLVCFENNKKNKSRMLSDLFLE